MRKLLPIAVIAVASVVLVGCNVLQPTASTNSTGTGANTAAGINGSPNQNNTGTPTSGGNPKSQYWPTDVGTLDAGYDFTYAKLSDTYYLSYKVSADKDAKSIGDDVKALLTASGWVLPADGTLESDTAVVQTYTKASNTLTMSIGKDDATTNIYSINIITGPQTSQ